MVAGGLAGSVPVRFGSLPVRFESVFRQSVLNFPGSRFLNLNLKLPAILNYHLEALNNFELAMSMVSNHLELQIHIGNFQYFYLAFAT